MLQSWSKTFITLSYFVVFCCADFCFSFMLYCIHIILLIITTDTHKPLVWLIYSRIYLCFYLGIRFFSFCTVMLVASLSIIVVVFFFYILCLMFLFWCTLILYLYSNTFVNSLKRTMSLGRLSRKRNREINVDSQSELSEQKSSLWVAYFCLLGCTNGLAFQV